MNKKSVKDIDVRDKRVLVRCDFNVPLDADKNILLKTVRALFSAHISEDRRANSNPNTASRRLQKDFPNFWVRKLKWQKTL